VDFGTAVQGVVAYSYLAEQVPKKLAENEVPELRTETSYTKFDKVIKEGKDPTLQLTSIIYSQPAYAQAVDGSWHYLEYATTTEQAFRDRDAGFFGRIAEVFVRTAYADTVSPFSEVGDGYVYLSSSSDAEFDFDSCPLDDWGVAHDGTTGTANYVITTADARAYWDFYFSPAPIQHCTGEVHRVFVPFITSAIPSAATISTATLNVYIFSKVNTSNDTFDYLTVVQSSQATHTVLASADYDNCGAVTSPTEGIDSGERKDITSISTGAYLVITLNATGRGFIAKSGVASNCSATPGITCLGVRVGNDTTNTSPGGGDNQAVIYMSERTGTSEDPYLAVTYTTGSSAVKSGMKVGSNGSLKVTSGGVKIK
jgi:hypothetical protein